MLNVSRACHSEAALGCKVPLSMTPPSHQGTAALGAGHTSVQQCACFLTCRPEPVHEWVSRRLPAATTRWPSMVDSWVTGPLKILQQR